MKKLVVLFLAVVISFMVVPDLQADTIDGYMIPEYYSVLSHHEGDEGIQGEHGFWLRRIYFTYNTILSKALSARVRLEMGSPAFTEGTLVPFVKDAWLAYKLGGGAKLKVGIMEPPAFNLIEKFWGYRYLEKTLPDLFKMYSSRDFGIALDGKSKGGLVYTLMYSNYSSNKSEDNKGKAVHGRIGFEGKSFYVEANGNYAADGSKKYTYLTGFGGFKGSFGRVGLAYHFWGMDPEEGDSDDTSALSAFGTIKLGKKSEIVLRYDHFMQENLKDPGGYLPVAATLAPPRLLIAGFTFQPHKMIKITPNIKYVFYGSPDAGDKPDADIYINLTAKISFKTGIGGK